jgi:hypothetical protein
MEKDQLKLISMYKSVFGSENGQRVLWDLMKVSGYTSNNFDENPQQLAYNEGLRSMVIRIVNLVEMDTQQISKLTKKYREADNYERFNFDG